MPGSQPIRERGNQRSQTLGKLIVRGARLHRASRHRQAGGIRRKRFVNDGWRGTDAQNRPRRPRRPGTRRRELALLARSLGNAAVQPVRLLARAGRVRP